MNNGGGKSLWSTVYPVMSLTASGFSSDDDNDSTSTSSELTVDSGSTQLAKSDSSSGSSVINLDNCKDFHVGPKLIADVCHINVNGEPGFIAKVTEKLVGHVEFRREGAREKAPAECRKYYGRFTLYLTSFAVFLLVVTFVTLVVIFLRQEAQADHYETYSVATEGTTASTTTGWTQTTVLQTTLSNNSESISSTLPPSLAYTYVARTVWQGRDPPSDAVRNRTSVQAVIIDDTSGSRCSNVSSCSVALKQLESKTNVSLNYNFLIDDSGNVYEGRGWNFASDPEQLFSTDLIKIAFIGGYDDSHLTSEQIENFNRFLAFHYGDFSSSPLVKAQCCRDIAGETGPAVSVPCDLYKNGRVHLDVECLSEVHNCDKRKFWQYFWDPFDCER